MHASFSWPPPLYSIILTRPVPQFQAWETIKNKQEQTKYRKGPPLVRVSLRNSEAYLFFRRFDSVHLANSPQGSSP
ncbi:hypothetical protein E2562_022826 [Oryza meyeriana var. granulata]|uniref:Uncharacterized protein n=1 Tax=Oryza meyeriana var. granulata TaxID=110450 RepID=A0A6G1FB54_9ORYZ|nr:hypothetical protein E2562_022826 [Oryza meyeriana var. granulata]